MLERKVKFPVVYRIVDRIGGLRGLWFVALVFLVSRIFYLVAGEALARIVPVHPFQKGTQDVPYRTLSLWSHWDGEHYIRLALDGYLAGEAQLSPAFFPMYSLLLRSVAELFGVALTPAALSMLGVVVSLFAFFFALYFVYALAAEGWGEAVARRAVLALAFFPTAFFFNSVYTESLFLMFSAGAVWAARVRRDLLLAVIFAALATATRNVGVFLILPLAHEWLRDPRGYGWRGAYLALAPAGLVVYMGYLWLRFGELLLFYTDQSRWGREATGPLESVGSAFTQSFEELRGLFKLENLPGLDPGPMADYLLFANDTLNLLFLLGAAALLAAGLMRLPWGLSGYVALTVFLPAFFGSPQSPLLGFPRYVLVAFPLFVVIGTLLKNRALFAAWLTLSAVASLALCALFVSWRFVA